MSKEIKNSFKTKPHYLALDGLRGVAALLVVAYHIFGAYTTSPFTKLLNHGYLAVDLFSFSLVLSSAMHMMTDGTNINSQIGNTLSAG